MSPNTARKAQVDQCGIWSTSEHDPEPSRCHQSNKMTDSSLEPNLAQIEELILCGFCKRPFNDTQQLPKDLACKHTFCLECIQSGLQRGSALKGSSVRSGELYCDLCCRLTELTDKGAEALETNSTRLALVDLVIKLREKDSLTNGVASNEVAQAHETNQVDLCITHGCPIHLWCFDCKLAICSECQTTIHADSRHHRVWALAQANEQLKKEAFAELSHMSQMDDNVRQLGKRQRQFLALIRDACNALTREVQASLDSDWNVDPTAEIRQNISSIQLAMVEATGPKEMQELFAMLIPQKQALEAKCREMIVQCQLNDLIGNSEVIFNFDSLNQAVKRVLTSETEIKPIPLPQAMQDPILFLTNYCMSQIYSRISQRANDSVLWNYNMQRRLGIAPPDFPGEPLAITLPSPPHPLNDLDAHSISNDVNVSQVEYPQHQQVPLSFDNPADLVELSRPSTPPDAYSSPSTPQANFTPPPPATTAQIVQMQSPVIEQVETPAPIIHPPVRPVPARSPANVSPRYFFNISINGVAKGQIVIETRPDVAPKMCRNFARLTTADRKNSYKGCSFFQCWKNESVITGDFEFNTGRGGRSIYEEGYFQPDHSMLPAVRGAVGMRRQQKKHDYFGLVGSQFRIILQEMQGFTGIFGHVVEGIDLVELIASHGDQTGKPVKPILITRCGKL